MYRVLLVDDEAMILRIMSVALQDRGFEVRCAHNGEQALEVLESFDPDAVVTDVDMPRMNGRELAEHLRQRHDGDVLPIFIVTAKSMIEHRSWSKHIDNLHFLEKPVSLRKLCSHLGAAIESCAGKRIAK